MRRKESKSFPLKQILTRKLHFFLLFIPSTPNYRASTEPDTLPGVGGTVVKKTHPLTSNGWGS